MPPKGERYYNSFYWQGEMTNKELELVDGIYKRKSIDQFKGILNDITLHDFQTLGVASAYINKRFFLGDGPGLGKTVQASAYLKFLKLKKEMKKFIICTTTDAVFQIKGEVELFTGLRVLPLIGDSVSIINSLVNYDFRQFDGIIIQHSGLYSNELGKFFSHFLGEYDTFVLDESSVVKSKTSKSYERAKIMSNAMNRVLFMNGTAFETHLFDFYYQFDALNEMLLPAVSNIKKDYCKIGGGFWKTEKIFVPGGGTRTTRKFQNSYAVTGYKHQELFREKVKYHYLAREKKHVYGQLPPVNYLLEPVLRSPVQRQLYNNATYETLLNSPPTSGYDFEFNGRNVPKLARTLALVQEITGVNKEADEFEGTGEQVVVYCWYREAQYRIEKELKELGITCCIINGETDNNSSGDFEEGSVRENLRRKFNNHEFKVVITNIKRALNLPAANYMILYSIDSNPQSMYQIMKRIDRNNMTDPKTYYFMVYADSHELERLQTVLTNRELQGNLFTGTTNDVFKILNEQIKSMMEGMNFSTGPQGTGQIADSSPLLNSSADTGYTPESNEQGLAGQASYKGLEYDGIEVAEEEFDFGDAVEISETRVNTPKPSKSKKSTKSTVSKISSLYDSDSKSFDIGLRASDGSEITVSITAKSHEEAKEIAVRDYSEDFSLID